jgi:serine phosphatase RsbU (regulator of sigma subunit)
LLVTTAITMEEAFTSYWWNRLGKKELCEKLTYSRLFLPWQWVLGTGIYIDDIEEEVNRRKQALIDELRNTLRQIVIGKTGYMYVFDSKMNMIIHPNPKLEGTNFEPIKNPLTGKSLARELAAAAHQDNNELVYVWDRPTDPGNYVYDKISWVSYFKGFDWYVGSSVYTNELYDASRLLAKRILLSSVLAFIGSLILGGFFLKRLVRPIEHLSSVALQVQKGDLDVRSGIQREDEIGILAREFDAMVEELKENVEKLDAKVREKTRELNENYDKLEEANRQIIDSIQYAETIQHGILPKTADLTLHMKEHFVIWEPKAIIGGDFYWFSSQKEGFLIAVADCTGHGVPGAIMTMVAGMALQQVVKEVNATDPSVILKALNRMVQRVLNQHISEAHSDDGLDIGICHVSRERGLIRFAGARIDLYYTLGGEFMFLKGDKQSIGYKSSDIHHAYTTHEFHLEPDMRFYMTTDGLLDQGGGPKGFPFGKRRFWEFLVAHRDQSLEEQKAALKRELSEYRGDLEQRDDMTVFGFVIE